MRARRLQQLAIVCGLVLALGCKTENDQTGGTPPLPGTPTPTPAPTPTPTPTPAPTGNRSPVITNITVTPAFGVSGLTTFSMSATATDADGDALTYTWTFAGVTMSGGTVSAT